MKEEYDSVEWNSTTTSLTATPQKYYHHHGIWNIQWI